LLGDLPKAILVVQIEYLEQSKPFPNGQAMRNLVRYAWLLAFCVAASIGALSLPAAAQQSGKLPRLGILFPASPASFALRTEALRQGLRELGYIEGKTVLIEWRWAENKVEKLPELAAELVKLRVDIIIANGTPAIRAAKSATTSIPIVMAAIGDPVATGLVKSLAHPGGNITGTSILAPELSSKRLELLREVAPSLAQVSAILNPTNPTYRPELRDTEAAARSLGMQIQTVEVSDPEMLQAAFSKLTRDRGRALLIFTDAILYSLRRSIVEFAAKHRLPAVYWQREFADDGGLMSYGPYTNELFRRSAFYVDKILKGTRPSDIPVEQPTKFELVINLRTAHQIGLTIPPNVLVRADRVIR
jgi:putative ABC transport system substrate-binding protein